MSAIPVLESDFGATESEKEALSKRGWQAAPGDVFGVSQPTFLGTQHLIGLLVKGCAEEGSTSPQQRRYFVAQDHPADFLCCYPFEGCGEMQRAPGGFLPPPKIVVLLADPRRCVTAWWRARNKDGLVDCLATTLRGFLWKDHRFLEDHFELVLAWSAEATLHPEHVMLCRADKVRSSVPEEAAEELGGIADFLGIPRARVAELQRLGDLADSELLEGSDRTAANGDALELGKDDLDLFQDALCILTPEELELWRLRLETWVQSGSSCLRMLAWLAAKNHGSKVQLSLMAPLKGVEEHKAGVCKPCVFAVKKKCRYSAEECPFCHADGHRRINRMPKYRRKKVREMRHLLEVVGSAETVESEDEEKWLAL